MIKLSDTAATEQLGPVQDRSSPLVYRQYREHSAVAGEAVAITQLNFANITNPFAVDKYPSARNWLKAFYAVA